VWCVVPVGLKMSTKGMRLRSFTVSEKLRAIKELLCLWIKNVRARIYPTLVDRI
jgi:hypothetical protein